MEMFRTAATTALCTRKVNSKAQLSRITSYSQIAMRLLINSHLHQLLPAAREYQEPNIWQRGTS